MSEFKNHYLLTTPHYYPDIHDPSKEKVYSRKPEIIRAMPYIDGKSFLTPELSTILTWSKDGMICRNEEGKVWFMDRKDFKKLYELKE